MTDPSVLSVSAEQDATAGLSYEQARDELIDVVRQLEAGGTALEDSLALWERGEALAARCQTWLDGARVRLDASRDATDHPADNSADNSADTDSQ